jgi:transposase
MAKQSVQARKRYTVEYKAESLRLAGTVGVPAAARQLGLHESQLYGWRARMRLDLSRGEAERQALQENARLKRQVAEQAEELAILKKAAAYFAKGLK